MKILLPVDGSEFSGGNGYMGEDVHIRDVVKYTDYKRFGSTSKIIFQGQDITPNQPNQPGKTTQPNHQ